jgi:hypothetical protein
MCRLSWNLGTSTSWNPQGLSRSVIGLLYLLRTVMKLVSHLGQLWLQSLFLNSPLLRLIEWSSWRNGTNSKSWNELLSFSVQIEARFNCRACFCHCTLYKASAAVYCHCRKGTVNTLHNVLWRLTLSVFCESGSVLYCRFYIRKTHFLEIKTYVWTNKEGNRIYNERKLFLCLNLNL